jgi:hypothetical protein
MMTGEGFRKLGFWLQLVLLGLVDWGTVVAFSRHEVPAIHYVGFGLVNAGLLGATIVVWRWLPSKSPKEIARAGGNSRGVS